ncbi:MAG: methyltransferase domain-containing protein [Fibrobacter sp.]|nr:methyltransferase domain-containing protein [Fibrobacter sp.]
MSNWMYNEFKHCGVDYSDEETVSTYNKNHQSFRDYEKEFNGILDFLSLKQTEHLSLIDLGCGTGAISRFAVRRFKKVYAVDVSQEMLKIAGQNLSLRIRSH